MSFDYQSSANKLATRYQKYIKAKQEQQEFQDFLNVIIFGSITFMLEYLLASTFMNMTYESLSMMFLCILNLFCLVGFLQKDPRYLLPLMFHNIVLLILMDCVYLLSLADLVANKHKSFIWPLVHFWTVYACSTFIILIILCGNELFLRRAYRHMLETSPDMSEQFQANPTVIDQHDVEGKAQPSDNPKTTLLKNVDETEIYPSINSID